MIKFKVNIMGYSAFPAAVTASGRWTGHVLHSDPEEMQIDKTESPYPSDRQRGGRYVHHGLLRGRNAGPLHGDSSVARKLYLSRENPCIKNM